LKDTKLTLSMVYSKVGRTSRIWEFGWKGGR
jgi:hypothetical protein